MVVLQKTGEDNPWLPGFVGIFMRFVRRMLLMRATSVGGYVTIGITSIDARICRRCKSLIGWKFWCAQHDSNVRPPGS